MGAIRRPGPLIAGIGIALLIVGAAAIALNRIRPTDTSRAMPSGPGSTAQPVAVAASYGADDAPGASSQRDAPETRWRPSLSPKAPWLAASPSPIVVSVTTDATRSSESRISPAGGDLFISTSDTTDIRLEVRPDTLSHSREFNMTPVTGISGLPFTGGLVAAVVVTPESEAFRRPAKLVFETRQPIPAEQTLVGFAVRGGKELHLYINDAQQRVGPKSEGPLSAFFRPISRSGPRRSGSGPSMPANSRCPGGRSHTPPVRRVAVTDGIV